jgi:hypothetical protein|tara:strand:+ start:359 stop:520 length:162 start_codon:yes stop_codon:yes gene_type:complete
MEIIAVEYLGKENGLERKKISLTNPKARNVMADAQNYFTKEEKKQAKLNHKNK